MELYFNSKCLSILCDIEKLANKHNCIVHFGVEHHNIKDFNVKDCDGYTPAIGQELKEKGFYYELNSEVIALWFQLIDNKIKHAQSQKRLVFVNGYERTQYCYNYRYSDLSDEAKKFLENMCEDIDRDETYTTYILRHPLQFTNIIGFKNEKRPNIDCLQMALKVFSDLVCDYLQVDKTN